MNVRLACVVVFLAGSLPGLAYPQAPAPTWRNRSRYPRRAAVPAAPEAPTADVPGSVTDVSDGEPPSGTVPAIWIAREVSFTYFSSTSLYYCDGLRTKVKWVMKQLGLMDGYKVAHPLLLQYRRTGNSLRARRPGVLLRGGVHRRGS